ncbi:MAG: Uma2 family endonuclease [Anaerolineaceae bacterium]|nr:Uma2 family endonuclease [Anaerolineaceae bacterium]
MFTLVMRTDSPKVVGPPQGHWTYADWETLPADDNRYEIIDGVLYRSTSPSAFHQWIIKRLVTKIGTQAEEQGLAYIYFAPIGVIMPGCDPIQPDFVVVRAGRESIIHERGIRGVPDLIAEVLSPGNHDYDEEVKKAAYENAGVPEYLIVDPITRTVRHFLLNNHREYGEPRIYTATDTLALDCLPTLPIRVEELFAGSPHNKT